jgi:hypothetical protein
MVSDALSPSQTAYMRSVIPSPDRERDDFYPTPPGATRALLGVETFTGPIWECACGEGDMARVLQDSGHHVISTDLIDRGFGEARVDFLMEWQSRAPNVVTNPPFKHAEEFARKALALTAPWTPGGKVAMLARLAWLEGKGRRVLFESTPLARVWVFAGRLSFERGKLSDAGRAGGMVAFAWFVWEHGHSGPPALGWISPDGDQVTV